MTLYKSQSPSRQQWQSVAPEHLLMLAIFGRRQTKCRVAAELDRRAASRPRNHSGGLHAVTLRPAA
jgi:hypothetical protein